MNKEIINIDSSKCNGCGLCVADCIRKRLILIDKKAVVNVEVPCMECGHCIAICPENAFTMSGYNNEEVIEFTPDKFEITSERLLNFIKFRRSIRQFKSDNVDDSIIKHVIEGGRFTPTAANRQTIRYIILKEKLPEIREMALKALYDVAVNNSKNLKVTNLDTYGAKWISNYEEYLHDKTDKLFWDAPVVILVVGSKISGGWVELNGGLASNSIELMLRAEGLGSCYIGFFGVACEICPEIRSALGIVEDEAVISTQAVGYPKIKYNRTTVRKPAKIDTF
jgi:nitroreductase/NAD-dependent dihydropyrimidine dehydrogenase PreA subunit